MHVLVIPSWYPDHADDISGSFFREQALALSSAGHRVSVVYPEIRSLREVAAVLRRGPGVDESTDEGMTTLRFRGVNFFPRYTRLAAWQWVHHGLGLYARALARNGRPDIVHAHSALFAGLLARALHQREGLPYVLTEHSTAYARGLLDATRTALSKDVVRCAQRCIAVSAPFAALLARFHAPPERDWDVIPNPVHRSFFQPRLRERTLRADPTILCVAQLSAKKGIDDLLRAFALVLRRLPNAHLRLGGDGPERPRLQQLTRELGVEKAVTFLGPLPRPGVVAELAQADVFALASRHETFGVVVAEALAMGVPVVATRSGGPESIIRESVDGHLVDVGDVASLAQRLLDVCSDGHLDPEVLRDDCRARFGEAAVVERLSTLYEEVLQE